MMERTLDISYDRIIVGISLSALSFALENDIPLIFLRKNKPTIYNSNLDNSNIKEYDRLCYELCMRSRILFSGQLFSIRIDEDNTLAVTTNSNILIRIKYNKLYIADDYKLEGLPIVIGKTSDDNLVTDFFNVLSGKNENITELPIKDNMIKSIIFYRKSDRDIRDCYCISYIKDKNLEKFEYSQSYARLKINNLMIENGFKGRWDSRNNMFKKVIIQSAERIITPLGKNIYEDLPENIILI
jgi:hypothetical protein